MRPNHKVLREARLLRIERAEQGLRGRGGPGRGRGEGVKGRRGEEGGRFGPRAKSAAPEARRARYQRSSRTAPRQAPAVGATKLNAQSVRSGVGPCQQVSWADARAFLFRCESAGGVRCGSVQGGVRPSASATLGRTSAAGTDASAGSTPSEEGASARAGERGEGGSTSALSRRPARTRPARVPKPPSPPKRRWRRGSTDEKDT